jgi:UV DNA damage endonuclease
VPRATGSRRATTQAGSRRIRFGLCCAFREQPIKFGTTTAAAIGKLSRADAVAKLARLCLANADALIAALSYCTNHGIGCFRVCSQILPLKTHPHLGYEINELPNHEEIVSRFISCGQFAARHGLRTCFHPDQFVVLNSQRNEVVQASIEELEYQAEVAHWIGADVINIHAGGAFGDKARALAGLEKNLERLSPAARERLTLENDDKIFTPADLLPLCKSAGVPLVFDVHHHRCHPDGLTVEDATQQAAATWNREPLFHLSSPMDGWDGPRPERHHDFIDPADFPHFWKERTITVEVEAKAKELAVERLMAALYRAKQSSRSHQRCSLTNSCNLA